MISLRTPSSPICQENGNCHEYIEFTGEGRSAKRGVETSATALGVVPPEEREKAFVM